MDWFRRMWIDDPVGLMIAVAVGCALAYAVICFGL